MSRRRPALPFWLCWCAGALLPAIAGACSYDFDVQGTSAHGSSGPGGPASGSGGAMTSSGSAEQSSGTAGATAASGGMSAGGGGSGGSGCTPKQIAICYTGPTGTAGVGICKPGQKTCQDDGTAFGPCAGEVTPKPETCLTPDDDDCNGKTNEGGSGCACKPKQSTYCYTGDPKTSNVGICMDGIKTCKDDGTAWGACSGQVLPKTEDCKTAADEDCDGKTPLCAPDWALAAGDAQAQLVHAIAVDGNGNVAIAGEFAGTMKLGAVTLSSAGLVDAFVAKLDKSGNVLWAESYGDGSNQAAMGVSFDAQGDVLLTGYFAGVIDFGGGNLTSLGGADVFVAKLAGTDGTQSWAARFGSAADDQVGMAIAVDSNNDPIVTGFFRGQLTFVTTLTTAGQTDIFVAKLAAVDGASIWGVRFGSNNNLEAGRAVAVDGSGDVLITGDFTGTFSIGATNLSSAGQQDIFVAKLGGVAGAAVWAKKFGGAGIDIGRALALGGSGGPIVVGDYEGKIDFGGGDLQSAGGADMFVAEYDGAGTPKQSKRFGGAGDEAALGVARDGSNGDYGIVGFSTGSIDFGSGVITSAGGRDGVIALLDNKLAGKWARRFGDATFYQRASCTAINKTSKLLAAGDFSGKADFGTGIVTSAGSTDAFVAAYP